MEEHVLPPAVSFGTYKLKGKGCYDATLAALEMGYRSIDTARVYGNEREVGEAVLASGISRPELFITTKIAPADMDSEETAYAAIQTSLNDLQVSYLDLCLIHWPGRAKTASSDLQVNKVARLCAWRALLRAKHEGLCRHVGVSNYLPRHLAEMDEPPSVNQVEVHPLFRQEILRADCARRGIAVQAYSSLGSSVPEARAALLEHPSVLQVAAQQGLTTAQVCLLWAAQQGLPCIPKASSPAHMRENLETLRRGAGCEAVLSAEQMDSLNSLPEQKLCWDPDGVL